ncbi:MFS transporter [Nocardia cyriacigeorgica]|uniref:MFS transporter n=1 Tax=Nocardia cyriacigeorgica TaxID=135487 RepID=UPI0024556D9B|nr:MFS transporter [Nocardia cyriacigeorgica]
MASPGHVGFEERNAAEPVAVTVVDDSVGSKSIPAEVWFASIAAFLNRTTGFLALFSAVFYKSMELSASAISLALLAVGVSGVLGSVAGGWSAVRFGPLTVMIAGSVLNAPLLLSLAFVSTQPTATIVIASLSVAVTQSFIGPAATVVTESTYAGSTLTAFAFYRIFFNVGTMVVPAVTGIVGAHNFGPIFVLSSMGSLATAVMLSRQRARIAAAMESTGRRRGGASTPSSGPDRSYDAYRRARLWAIVVVFGIAMLIHATSLSSIPLSVQRLDQGDRLYTILFLINPAVIIFLELPLSFLVAKMRWNHAFGLGVFINGAGLALCGIGTDWSVCIIGFVIFSIGEAVFVPLVNASVATISSGSENTRFQSHLSAAQSIGFATGPGIGAFGVLHSPSIFWVAIVLFSLFAGVAATVSGIKMRSNHVE